MRVPSTELIIKTSTPPEMDDAAESYVESTKIHRRTMGVDLPNISKVPAMTEIIKASFHSTKSVSSPRNILLPEPASGTSDNLENEQPSNGRLEDVLRRRSSAREIFPAEPMTLEILSYLLWCADGVTKELQPGQRGRTAPSGGALYPRDVYCIMSANNAVAGLRGATWHYNPYNHSLEWINDSGLESVFDFEWHQSVIEHAQGCFIVSGNFWRNRFKYNLRGTRFAHLEAGMVTENFLLAATVCGIQAMPFGGYFDDELARACGMDGLHEAPLSVVLFGGQNDAHTK
ncbi:SagB/ThcOx family dehydrogenase [Corynebacterium glaucum]|uniref:SagB/ThcOx family dehydrogenase n=1 Tax=Corynebacterium glaucum TaxID=187491 RepID=UPI00265A258D|nr:SagB/ThcOx family dehydrogenase [Corynebacterium glaucum]